MDFQKKDWQFRDIISENELNRMEDGIEEGITKAEQAQQTATDAQTNLDNHVSATTGVHGATSAATPNTIVQRDGSGQFEVGAPTDANHVARKAELDSVIDSLNAHTGRTDNPHHTTADQVGAPSLTKIVPDGTSLNTVTTSGFYRLGTNHQDAPSGVDYGQMIVSRGGDTILQIVTGFNNNEFYIRHGNPPEAGGEGVWQPWRKLWHDGNLPYETGAWTPELTFGNSSSGITYSNRKGQYTRIRNVVYWTMEMQLSSKGTATGTARISGLPFIPLSTAPDVILPVGYATRITLPSGGEWASAQIFWNSAVLVLFASGNVGTNANITNEHFADNSGLKIQGFYFIPN